MSIDGDLDTPVLYRLHLRTLHALTTIRGYAFYWPCFNATIMRQSQDESGNRVYLRRGHSFSLRLNKRNHYEKQRFSRSDGSGFASKLIRRRFFSLLAVLSLILGVIGNMAVVRAADESAGGEVAVEAVTSEDTPVVESPLESNVVDPTRLEAAVDVPTTGVGDQVLQARDVGATLMQAMGLSVKVPVEVLLSRARRFGKMRRA